MENVFNTLASTTYRISYPLCSSVLPPIKYHQQPAIQLRDEPMLHPRSFPISPAGPTRGWEKGTGQVLEPDIRLFTYKPIVRAPPPQDITIPTPPTKPKTNLPKPKGRPADSHALLEGLSEPLAPVVPRCADGYPGEAGECWVEDLCQAYHWKTTSKEAAKEGCLPVPQLKLPTSTIEPRSDFLMYRPMRYNAHELPWQRAAPVWDRLQERHVDDNVSSRQIGGGGGRQATEIGKRRLQSPQKLTTKTSEGISLDDRIVQLVKEDKVASTFVRNCPGYAGYVPRSPLKVAMETSLVPDLLTMTTMKSSYRPFASKEYTVESFAHKGPLSRTVTLTYPYNPYNKVENRAEEIEHKW